MDLKTYLIRFAISIIVGGLIGLERELDRKPAGLRTMILVCLGSTIFMIIALELKPLDSDLGKIVAGVITGIGFLGAGAIIRAGGDVHRAHDRGHDLARQRPGDRHRRGVLFAGIDRRRACAGGFKAAGICRARADKRQKLETKSPTPPFLKGDNGGL